ncbi:IS256 family transposase [Facilibium subflavum]|uniref:IS256 family transposase n=1 Tax=Facilibium subflavum TaxID=2219058 RepID=UPI000E64E52B|nr:IS256 family transposase [Facilibium subflavum]
MSKDNVLALKNTVENEVKDALTGVIREAANKAIHEAIMVELKEFMESLSDLRLDDGKQQVVRNGYQPERNVATGVGNVKVKLPKVRDRKGSGIQFHSLLVPPYMRRAKTIDELLPLLYLQGISTNHFQAALAPILGENAKNVSPQVICRLKAQWRDELKAWQNCSLSDKRYVYWWVDGIYLTARMESQKTCILVIIGATEDGKKELVAFSDGFRESTDSWLELLRDIKRRGLTIAPELAIGDGAMGFWSAIEKEFPKTQHQRCWVHKTANILNKLPKSLQTHAKSKLHGIYMAPGKEEAHAAYKDFIATYQAKYPKAVECLTKDKEKLLTFYGFPAEHWCHIRSTNPIESTFATIQHRTRQARGCYSRETVLCAFFKMAMQAEKKWLRLRGYQRLAEVVNMVKFIDGISEHEVDKIKQDKQNAA